MKLYFTNMPFGHNSAYVIQKWFKFKRWLSYSGYHISHKYFVTDLKQSSCFVFKFKSCILVNLLKTEILNSYYKENYSKTIFSYFEHYFIFFNVNEHLAILLVELVHNESRVGYLCFFCLH